MNSTTATGCSCACAACAAGDHDACGAPRGCREGQLKPSAAGEVHCGACMSMHQPGPCPVTPEPIPETQPRAAQAPQPTILELLDQIRDRVKLVAEPTVEERKEAAGACDVCGVPREWRKAHRYRGTGMSPRSEYVDEPYCPVCDLCEDIPHTFRFLTFGSEALAKRVRRKEAMAQAQEAATIRKVVLIGPSGSGKTSLASAMFRWRADTKRERNAFISAKRLGLAREQHPLGEGEAPIVERAMTAPIVVLDDVGLETNGPKNAVPDVIMERVDAGRPTWVTTGFDQAWFTDRYGQGIARRVFQGARIIDCTTAGGR